MVHHRDPECHAKRLGSYLQGQCQRHSAGSNPQNKPPELLNLLQPNLVYNHAYFTLSHKCNNSAYCPPLSFLQIQIPRVTDDSQDLTNQ